MPLDLTSIVSAITAIGALGTASFGLVDATKAFGGGISLVGIRNIRDAIEPLFGKNADPKDKSTSLKYGAILANLRANWINGTALADQKAIAKALLKLRLNEANAADYANATGVDAKDLVIIAGLIPKGTALTTVQSDVFGRFDLALTALLDEGSQFADQRYRNWAKVLAGVFAILIAVASGYLLFVNGQLPKVDPPEYWFHSQMWAAVIVGALATPLAPIAKDLTSALAAGVDAVQKSSQLKT
jgi:hypothetical protein